LVFCEGKHGHGGWHSATLQDGLSGREHIITWRYTGNPNLERNQTALPELCCCVPIAVDAVWKALTNPEEAIGRRPLFTVQKLNPEKEEYRLIFSCEKARGHGKRTHMTSGLSETGAEWRMVWFEP
jgi:hypothetical protein